MSYPFDLEDLDLDLDTYRNLDLDLQDELPEKVKECEKSVREDNPDMDKSTAIAICRDQLDMQDEGGCPSGKVSVGEDCVPIEEVDAVPSLLSSPKVFQLAGLNTEPIERIEEGENKVRYTNIRVLGPGMWTDSNSRETVWYSPEGIKNLEVMEDNVVNIMHDADNEVSAAGKMEPGSEEADDTGVYVDVILDTSNAAGQYADENLQKTLETGGAKGFGGPSVEIPEEGQQIEFNEQKGMPELKAGKLSGMGFVKNPAAKSVSFARQSAERSVALSSSQTDKALYLKDSAMSAALDTETLFDTIGLDLEESDLDLEELDLQDGVAIQDLIGLIAKERDIPADQLMEAVSEMEGNGDGEEEDVENQEGEEEDVENQEGEEEEEEEGEDEPPEDSEEEEEDTEMEGNEMQEMVQSLQERVQNLEDMMDSMMATEELEEALDEEIQEATEELADAETVAELEDAKEELERRLEKLEEEPKDPKTLSDNGGKENVGGKISAIETRDPSY